MEPAEPRTLRYFTTIFATVAEVHQDSKGYAKSTFAKNLTQPMTLSWPERCEKITAIVHDMAQELDLAFEQVASMWYESVSGRTGGLRLWNVYQSYIRDEVYGCREQRRLQALEGSLPAVAELTAREVGDFYKSFKQTKNWKEVLVHFNKLSAPKRKRPSKVFDQGAAQARELAKTQTFVHETQLAEGVNQMWNTCKRRLTSFQFFAMRCRADKELIGLHLQAHTKHNLSLESIQFAFEDVFPARPPSHVEDREREAEYMPGHDLTSLTDLLRSAYSEDVQQTLCGRGFPWLQLTRTLAENGLFVDGYPADVRYPHESKGNQGVHGLRAAEKARLIRALELRKPGGVDPPSAGLRFKRYTGHKQGLSPFILTHRRRFYTLARKVRLKCPVVPAATYNVTYYVPDTSEVAKSEG
ncbi:hypothetical protein C8R47DRAFT_1082425 [Mycena vitilis]|nr:hypothetical protein C8R47DRAFT_1082425 [Mycena vitilis]